jgi:ketosteroid isomerase-like protein
MSRENVQLVRGAFDAVSRGDLDTAVDLTAEDAELHATGRLPGFETVRGRDAVKAWFEELLLVFDVQYQLEDWVDAGDNVVVGVAMTTRGRRSGVETVNQLTIVVHVKDGRFSALTAYATRAEALKAVGLSE